MWKADFCNQLSSVWSRCWGARLQQGRVLQFGQYNTAAVLRETLEKWTLIYQGDWHNKLVFGTMSLFPCNLRPIPSLELDGLGHTATLVSGLMSAAIEWITLITRTQTQWSINNSRLGDVAVANWKYSPTIEELVYIYISYSYNPGYVIIPPILVFICSEWGVRITGDI